MADTGTNKSKSIDVSQGGIVSGTGMSPYQDDIGTSNFTFGGKPPIEYIQFLLGEELFSLFGDLMLNEAFEYAFKSISEIIEDSVILENLVNSQTHLIKSKFPTGDDFQKDFSKNLFRLDVLLIIIWNSGNLLIILKQD